MIKRIPLSRLIKALYDQELANVKECSAGLSKKEQKEAIEFFEENWEDIRSVNDLIRALDGYEEEEAIDRVFEQLVDSSK